MTVELRRMYQRRGLEADLPQSPEDGEIYVTLDTKNVYMGISGSLIKLLNFADVVDDLSTQSIINPLSARQGFILQGRLNSLESFMAQYQITIDDLVNAQGQAIESVENDITLINTNVTNLQTEIQNKQDIVVVRDTQPPSDTSMIWFNTN